MSSALIAVLEGMKATHDTPADSSFSTGFLECTVFVCADAQHVVDASLVPYGLTMSRQGVQDCS